MKGHTQLYSQHVSDTDYYSNDMLTMLQTEAHG